MDNRSRALALYRAFYRAAKSMPTANRRDYIRKKSRFEFEENRHETDPSRIRGLLQFADLQLDNVQIQAKHLSELFARDPSRFEKPDA
ncbi:hypothetical protein KFL_000080340 [Klebsormidium nitens]|uniref:Complex 1 LYR protein domain-containing protein n=1 Tax=Klebsormidium nitens TaxID=105231 RepID=A0A1Y1HI38_KLENI|nr:hypothetical protein KFL_000080340 [Klebsormidium nitens]|eukprot:GAQ78130.1 hypothetical protein KFL_000080340 [Klebsormidium nitens]